MAGKEDDLDDELDSATTLELDDLDDEIAEEGDVADADPEEDGQEEDPTPEEDDEPAAVVEASADPRMAELEAEIAAARAEAQAERDRRELAERAGLETLSKGLDRDIAAVRTKLKLAKEEGDIEKDLELTEQLSDLKVEKADYDRKLKEVGEKPTPKAEADINQDPAVIAQVNAWVAKNAWFSNPKYAAQADYARTVYQRLQAKGLRPDSKAFYAEADKDLAAVFPHLYPKSRPVPTGKKPAVAPVGNAPAPKKKVNTYTFSSVDKEFAKALGKADDPAFQKYYARGRLEQEKRSGKR